jgi:hypothetical protein
LCALRAGLSALGVPVSSGAGIAQLIAPLMFVLIGVRLLGRGLRLALFGPPPSAGESRAVEGPESRADTP